MKIMKLNTLLAATFAITASSGFLYAGHHEGGEKDKKKEEAKMTKDIVAIAAGSEDFSTLVAAIKAAGLVETLQGDGPFTVFAPTNAAFAKLPEGTVETLLKPENKEKLQAVLTYHVIAGKKVMSKDVAPMKVATAQGSEATITVNDGTVKIDDAKVIKVDIEGSNGVIHVIDSVILPGE
jgi:uncharacterized surface protein with fasciclin (FAS1) repeats